MTADPFHIDLPLPPSVNALYRNVPGRGRVKTAAYKRWGAVAAGYAWRQKPLGGFPRFERNFEIVILVPAKMRGDVDNRAKASLDILKDWRIIPDDRHSVAPTVRRCMSIASGECRVTVKPAVFDAPDPIARAA